MLLIREMNNNGLFMISGEGELYLREIDLDLYKETLQRSSPKIKFLDLRNNSLNTVPRFICDFSALLLLDIRENQIEAIPENIENLSSLQTLKLDYNLLVFFPLQVYHIISLKTLTVSHNSLIGIDKRVKALENLTVFDISYNKIKSIPAEIGKLKMLTSFFIQGNEFIALPAVLHELTQLQQFSLEWLRYTYPSLPITLKGCTGEILIKSLQNLSNIYDSSPTKEITLLNFLKNFTDFPFSLEKPSYNGVFILHKAVLNSDIGVVKGLINSGYDINLLDSDGYSALVLSIRENNFEIAKLLLNAGCNANIGGGIYGSPLHLSVSKNELNLVSLLLKSKSRLDIRNNEGNTVMHMLMIHFQKPKHKGQSIGDLLLCAGAEVNVFNNDNWAPLHIASRKPQNSAMKWILYVNSSKIYKHCKFDINIPGGKQEWSALHLAAHAGLFKTAKLLFRAGAEIYSKNKLGKTPKDIAKGNLALYKYLTKLEKEYLKEYTKKNKSYFIETSEEYDDYGKLYQSFKERDADGIKKNIKIEEESEINQILAVDSIYLIGKITEKQPKHYIKTIAKHKTNSSLLIKEAIFALKEIKLFESKIISPRNIIGPRVSITSQVRKIQRNDSEIPED